MTIAVASKRRESGVCERPDGPLFHSGHRGSVRPSPGGNTQAVDRLDLGGGRRVVEARICNPRATGARVPGTSVVGSASISRSYEEGVWGG